MKLRHRSTTAWAALALCACAAAAPADRAQDLLDRGRNLTAEGKYDQPVADQKRQP